VTAKSENINEKSKAAYHRDKSVSISAWRKAASSYNKYQRNWLAAISMASGGKHQRGVWYVKAMA